MSLSIQPCQHAGSKVFTIPGTAITLNAEAVIFGACTAIGAAMGGYSGLFAGMGIGYATSFFMERLNKTSSSAPKPPVLSFLDGRADAKGRTYDAVLAMTDSELEGTHDWVQQVFPTNELSAHRSDAAAWVMTPSDISAVRTSPERKNKLKEAFARALKFYKLDRMLIPTCPFWVTPGNHNFERISRIITSLKLAGLKDEANLLVMRLNLLLSTVPGAAAAVGASAQIWSAKAAATV